MPELPNVEVFRRYVNATSLHEKIKSVEVRNEKILGGLSVHRLQRTLKGHTFESTRRHGKNLFEELDGGGWMLMHFCMTGSLAYFKSPDEEAPHSRLLFAFEHGYHLAFDCQRMFGKVDLVEDSEDFAREKELGPDLLQLDADSFRGRFEGRKGDVKAALMNQKVLAGIGNIYSDEILSQAQLHPRASVAQFDDPTLRKLHTEVRRVLKMAIGREAKRQNYPISSCYPTGAREEVPTAQRQDPEDQSRKTDLLLLSCMPSESEVTRNWPGKRNGRSSRNDLSGSSARNRSSGKVLSTPGSPL